MSVSIHPLQVGLAKRLRNPRQCRQHLYFGCVPMRVIVMAMREVDSRRRTFPEPLRNQHSLEVIKRPISVDQIVAIEHHSRVAVMRSDPEIVTRVAAEEAAKPDVKRNVKRWRGGQMVLRWVAAGVLEAVKGLRRLKGHKEIPKLIAALRARDQQLGLIGKDAERVA